MFIGGRGMWISVCVRLTKEIQTMSNPEKIIHFVPELGHEQVDVLSLCGQTISWSNASNMFTNCPVCQRKLREIVEKRIEEAYPQPDFSRYKKREKSQSKRCPNR
jgi:PHP family Zn ribbon phosphoesterase